MLPKRLGKYELQEEIARGAYGIVHRARDLELGRIVALKHMRNEEASEEAVERFRREARTAARLCHPHLIRIFDMGEEEGRLWYAMELVEGMTLSAAMYTRRLDTPKAARLFGKIARAVHYAHENGVVHRDLKPGNILLRSDGDPAIADFGVARDLRRRTSLTMAGELLGTPSYMAPEQISGRGGGAHSDIYSIGVMIHELLTGRTPFTACSFAELSMKILNDEPPPPSRSDPTVDPDLERICLRCLRKEPIDRYATAAELADDLAAVGQSLRPPAPPLPAPRRRRGWIGLAGAGLVSVLMAAASVHPRPGRLLETEPPGASIHVDGRFVGHSPAVVDADWAEIRMPGRPTVMARPGRIALPGHAPDRMKVVGSLYVDAAEVSQGDYLKFVQATGARAPWRSPVKSRAADPVTGISWDEAAAYAAWAGKRLPTGAEWREIASSGAVVMAGGVQEWTLDAEGEFRALCGGSDLMPEAERSAAAVAWRPRMARLPDAGFRCVKDVTPARSR